MQILNLTSTLQKLADTTFCSAGIFHFLGYSLDLQTGVLQDVLQQNVASPEIKNSTMHTQLAELLTKYASAGKHDTVGKLVNFKDFSGGYAYENAFHRRVVEVAVKLFGSCPQDLVKAAELLGGKILEYGDCSVEIEVFPGLPLTFILWVAEEELPPSMKVFFDASANQFFNVEDLAWLSDLTVWRLSVAQTLLKNCK